MSSAQWLSTSVDVTRRNHGADSLELAHELQTFAEVLLQARQLRHCRQVALECRDVMCVHYGLTHPRVVDIERLLLQVEADLFTGL